MHVVIINGSPRVQKFSNTDKIITAFARGLTQTGATFEQYAISDRTQWENARNAYLENDRILIALPLYVECIPGLLLEFLETLPVKDKEGTQIAFLLQSGYAEGCQLRCGEEFLEMLPGQLGCSYGGTLVKGDNFSIRVVEDSQREQLVKPYEQMGILYGQTGNFFAREAKKFTGPETFSRATQLFIGLVFNFFAGRTFRKVAAGWGCTKPLDDRPYH